MTQNYNGGFHLVDSTRGAIIHTWNVRNTASTIGRIDLTDNDNNWTTAEHSPENDDMGLDVFWSLQQIYDYFLNHYQINSLDDQGLTLTAYVRWGNTTGTQDNAGWHDDNYFFFGDGEVDFRPVASLDVVGHEYGHGLTDFQIGWGSLNDQNAFHEGLSDIWGAILEQRINPGSQWRIGEQITLNKPYLRNIQYTNDANSLVQTADTYNSTQYNNASGNLKPYIRGGVFAHWFYILSNGEVGINDIGSSYNVTGIGLDLAEELIAEAVFNNYLDNTTSYAAIRTSFINAASALYCANSPEVKAVTNAWYAVGVGSAFNGTLPSISGTEPVCTTRPFTLNNQPANTTLSWSSGNVAQMTVASNGTVSRINNYSGSANLIATISGTGGCQTSISKQIWLGNPIIATMKVDGNNYYDGYPICPGNHWASVTYNGFASPATWTVQSGITYFVGSNQIDFTLPYNGYSSIWITAKASNVCAGTSYNSNFYLTKKTYGCGSMMVSIFPNPSSESLNLETSILSYDNESPIEIIADEIELLDENGQVLIHTFPGSSTTQLDTRKIVSGQYYLHVRISNEIIKRHIFVER
jgi:hypothetical protein